MAEVDDMTVELQSEREIEHIEVKVGSRSVVVERANWIILLRQ